MSKETPKKAAADSTDTANTSAISTPAPSKTAPVVASHAVKPVLLSLTDFCTRLSVSVSSPELISGFEYSIKQKPGFTFADEAQWRVMFEAFKNQPV